MLSLNNLKKKITKTLGIFLKGWETRYINITTYGQEIIEKKD